MATWELADIRQCSETAVGMQLLWSTAKITKKAKIKTKKKQKEKDKCDQCKNKA